MRSLSGHDKPVADMIAKRCIAAAILVCLGPLLGSCGGANESGLSSYVADHWPHWAGGMPDDVPPRPGTPGYDEFIAHGQADQDATKSVPPGGKPVASATAQPTFQSRPAPVPAPADQAATPAVQAVPPADNISPEDSSVVKGGLY
jgi:hypothetical protein